MYCWGNVKLSMEGDYIHPCDLQRRVGAQLLCLIALGGQAGPTRHAQTTNLGQSLSS